MVRSKPSNAGKEKLDGAEESTNLLNNKKISAVRSHQALATRNSNSNSNAGAPDRQLTRQSGNDHALVRPGKRDVNGEMVSSHLPRTRSLNQD